MPTESIILSPIKTLCIEYWPIAKLIHYAKNPRKNDQAVARMVASIREFGFAVPILARSSGEVVDGHLRLKAAKKLGLVEVPVILCDGWSEAQVKAFRLMVNRSVAWADWDAGLLGGELIELKGLGFNLGLTGFDVEEMKAFMQPLPDVEAAKRTLAERFIVPPFSVLDARQGYWQDRKRAWLALGIESELGRGDQLIPNGGGMTSKDRYAGREEEATKNGLTWGNSDPMRHPTLNHYREKKKRAGSPGPSANVP